MLVSDICFKYILVYDIHETSPNTNVPNEQIRMYQTNKYMILCYHG